MTENVNELKITDIKSTYKSEIAFDRDLKRFLQSKLSLLEYELEVGLKTKILLDIVFHPKISSRFYLHLSPTECDLVIYKRLGKRQIVMWSEIRKRFPEIIEFYRFGENEIVMPLVILETKNEGMSSHDLLLYSTKADKIKSIFPFVKYLLVCNYATKLKLTIAKHGKYFDDVYILHRKQRGIRQPTNNLYKLVNDIEQHFKKLEKEQLLQKKKPD